MRRFGLLVFIVRAASALTSYSPCDINHDGAVNIVDVQVMINQVLGTSVCTTRLDQTAQCDIVDVQREILAALGSACNTSPANSSAASIALTAPAASANVSGTYAFSVDTSNAPTTASVAYDLGSLRLGVATVAPFGLSWNTGFATDGHYLLLATAYDSTGAVLAQASVPMNVNNHGGYLSIASPDLTQPLSGSVTLSLTGLDPQGYYPARWNIFLDGQQEAIAWTDNAGQNPVSVSQALDTTTVPNGTHELHIEVASDYWPSGQQNNKTFYDHRIGLSYIITTSNGHTLMDLSAGYEHVYLQPGQSLALSCTQLFTDSTTGPCAAPSYSSSDTTIATVSSAGLLTAGTNQGSAMVTLTDSGKSTQVTVWVMNTLAIPHFAGNGQMLLSYQPGVSIFPVSPFALQPTDVQADSSLNTETKRAGVNTLEQGFYQNPRDTTETYSDWQSFYDGNLAPGWAWAANNGYHLYTMGDEVCRNIGNEAWWTLNWPSGQQAVQHAIQSLASSGVAIGIDMIDEGSMMWGATPTPPRKVGEPNMFTSVNCAGTTCTVTWPNNPVNSGRFYAGTSFALTGSVNSNLNTPPGQMFSASNVTDSSFTFVPAGTVNGVSTVANDPNLEFLWWAGSAGGCPTAPCDPPVPNTALSTIATWVRTASPTVPISWPALGIAPVSVQDSWAGKDSQVSDYMSHYWDSFQAGTTYTWGSGVAERVYWMRSLFYQRQPYARLDRPQVILGSISSYFYNKETAGAAYYNPPQDSLVEPGTSPTAVSAEMMTAAAIGTAGVRLYQFENSNDQSTRAGYAVGSQLQTGASPFATGDPKAVAIWKSMGYTANLLTKTLQPFILGVPLSSPALGATIVTAARQGSNGKLFMAVNGTDFGRTLTLNLSAYRTGNSITRYIVGSTRIKTALLADAATDTVTVLAGETVIYLFPNSASTNYLSTVPISAPALPTNAVGAILHQAYIYSQDLDSQTDGTSCTAGCSLMLDSTLGNVFYQFFFVDGNGALVSKSSVTTIPGN